MHCLCIENISWRGMMHACSTFILLAYVFDAQKNPLMETVLLSTHNICFG